MGAHLLIVRNLSHQHLSDLPGHVTIIIHFSLPENSDVCPNPVTEKPQLPYFTLFPLFQSGSDHRGPYTSLNFLPPCNLPPNTSFETNILNQKKLGAWAHCNERTNRTHSAPVRRLLQEESPPHPSPSGLG